MEGLKMKYFVLKPAGDDIYAMASRKAMATYANTIEEENPQFARDIREWISNNETKELSETQKGIEAGRALRDSDQ